MPLESPVQRDGDMGFTGFASRLNPLRLPPGLLQDSVNMRLDRGVARTRRGSMRLTDTIGVVGAPLTLNFPLGTDQAVANLTRSSTTATATVTAHGYTTGDQVNIRGADQNDYNGDFLVTVVDADTFTYTVAGSPATPATGTIVANSGPVVRDSYEGGLYSSGVFASQRFDNANEYIVLAGSDSATLYRQGLSPVVKLYPNTPQERIEATDTVSVVQAFDRFYILREADRGVAGWEAKAVTSGGITVSGTTATVNLVAHDYPVGARVRLEGSSTLAFDGHEFDIDTAATDSFTIAVPNGTVTDATLDGRTVRRVKPPLFWDAGPGDFVRSVAGVPPSGPTFKRMPSVGFASYINNRLIIPGGRDSVLVSDVLDADTYDPFWQSLRTGAGGSDFIVAIHPWVEGSVLIFCRKSIWLATLNQTYDPTNGDSLIARLDQLTNEIGCSARNTIVTAGQFVFFLSDAGIYRLDTQLDLKLRGDTMPLSEPVANLFSEVVQARVEKSAFGIWHNNRYLVALPTSPDPLDGNQLVIAWNALNQSWEYRDIYPSSASVNQILVGTFDTRRRIFSVPRSGNLYLLEENDNAFDDNAAGGGTSPVTGRLVTRRYNFGDLHSKRFLRVLADTLIPADAAVTTKITTVNPDKTEEIGRLQNDTGAAEDYNLKAAVRFKAHAAEVIYETSNGRPEIRSASIEAAAKSRPPTETRNAA